MTKVTILGQEPKEVKKLKPIEFKLALGEDTKTFQTYNIEPSRWSNITLLCRNYADEMDLMWCMDGDGKDFRVLVLGHFNDGVVSND